MFQIHPAECFVLPGVLCVRNPKEKCQQELTGARRVQGRKRNLPYAILQGRIWQVDVSRHALRTSSRERNFPCSVGKSANKEFIDKIAEQCYS